MFLRRILFITLLLNVSCGQTSPLEQKKKILGLLPHLLNNYHFKYVKIDDDLSRQSFSFYLKRLDYNKRFFLKKDIETLENYIDLIDDEIEGQSLEFFTTSYLLLKKRMKEAQTYLYHLDKPFNYNIAESVDLDPQDFDYCANTNELSERWRKLLKHQTVSEIVTVEGRGRGQTNKDKKEKFFQKIESQSRERVRKDFEDMYYRLERLDENDRFTDYVNSILNVFDPHTTYLPPRDEKNFNISMSGKLEGIGAVLQERDGMIKVVRVVPGSASWRQGQLKAGHVILKVGQGKKEPVDIVDMRLDEAVQLIRGKKNSEVRLTVKKLDGEIIVIPIIRDIVILEETFAKSALLSQTGDRQIGYIHLPKFYRDFQSRNERSCAKDVYKELETLKKKNVNGVIIDLRNNGGGSLEDVIEMTGLFIKEGPIVQVKRRQYPASVYRDKDTRVVYDGPLIVMVNSFSASASEIFAAAIQDYGRGVIVGSKSTYGKGTVQNFGPLGRYIPRLGNQAGSVKFTIQKFYRINGGATQLKGVIPDVILPDLYDSIDLGEREMDNAMPWTEIQGQTYDLWHLPYGVSMLKKESAHRVQKHPFFQAVRENSIRLKDQREDQTHPLKLSDYRREYQQQRAESKKFDEIPTTTSLVATPTKTLSRKDEVESEKIASQEEWVNNLQRDVYLEEAFFVMTDILRDY